MTPNPWFDTVLEQMWIVSQATDVMARCIDADLLSDPQALSDYCLKPTEQRLNPLEFHGKRRSAPPPRTRPGNPERYAAPLARPDRRAG